MLYRIILIYFLFCTTLFAAETTFSFHGDFQKETITKYRIEKIAGLFYYKSPRFLYFHIKDPVNQIVTFRRRTMLLFYPEEKKGFMIRTDSPFNPNFSMVFDLSLQDYDYKIIKNEKKDNITFTHWISNNKKDDSKIIVGKEGEKLISIEVHNKNKLVTKSTLSEHIEFKGISMPGKIVFENFSQLDPVKEIITYKNIKFNPQIPESILHFRFPETTRIKTIMLK